MTLRLSRLLICFHETEILGTANVAFVDDVVISTDVVLFLTSVESEWSEVDIGSADESESGQVLLESLELSVHHVKLEQLSAFEDVVEVFLREGHNDLMVPALPVGIAACVDDVGFEVLILTDNVFEQLRNSESHVSVWWFVLIDRVEETHG